MKVIGRGLIFFICLITIAIFLHPDVRFDSVWSALLTTVILSAINTFLKPSLKMLSMPLSFLTLGFFPVILNIIIIYFVSNVVTGFHISNPFWALVFSIVISILYEAVLFLFENFLGLPKE
jgi:putative membrane protein